ncbi:MAG: hypothetical protein R3C69_10355 [Geminicoccaceae bacterium]
MITQRGAMAPIHDQGAVLLVRGDRGERMEQALAVHVLEREIGAFIEHI